MLTISTIYRHIKTASEKYLAKYPRHMAHMVVLLGDLKVEINHRCRTKAGTAKWTRQIVNGALTANNFRMEISSFVHNNSPDEELFNTVSHELAHLLHAKLTGNSDHKSMWKQIHAAMRGDSTRCHKLESVKMNKRRAIKLEKNGKVFYVTLRRWAVQKERISRAGYLPIAYVERVPVQQPDGKFALVDTRIGSVFAVSI